QIEKYFRKHHIVFAYDEYSHGYFGIIRQPSSGWWAAQGISIYLYLDKNNKLERISVESYVTAP
ncbi:MAG: hypothetical protein ABSC92_05265, partial [Rhizomicrobium sp.]